MSDMMSVFILIGLLGPVLAGGLALLLGKQAEANRLIQLLFTFTSLMGGLGALLALGNGSTVGFHGLTTLITLDRWSALFLGLIHVGAFITSLYAIGYLPRYQSVYDLPRLNAATGVFLFGMQATVLASTVLSFLLFWEVMSLAGFFLVIADRERPSLRAGLWYFVMAHLGFSCLLLGFLLLAQGNPAATFADLAVQASALSATTLSLAFALLLAGFGSKAGLVPLHQWLPHAHPQAPGHSSALMSGVMLKVAVYGFLRVTFSIFPIVPLAWGLVIVALGLLSAFFGVLHAALETDLKRLLAWSSVENMGLIFTGLGLALVFRATGLSWEPFLVAALFHMVNHTVFKTGLFLAAGSIISETHTRDLDALGGLAKFWPWFSGVFLVLALAAAALPPFGAFYAEIQILQQLSVAMLAGSGLIALFSALVVSVIALVGGLAIFTFAKTFAAIFLSQARSEQARHVKPLPRTLVLPIALCAVLTIILGIFASPLMQATAMADVWFLDSERLAFFILAVGLISWSVVSWLANKRRRYTDTWDCGQPITARMEYTATGFAAPIMFFFRSLVLARKHLHTEPVSPTNPWILKRHLEWSTLSVWEAWLYRPFTRLAFWMATRVKRLQSGIIQFYIALIVITLVLALALAL